MSDTNRLRSILEQIAKLPTDSQGMRRVQDMAREALSGPEEAGPERIGEVEALRAERDALRVKYHRVRWNVRNISRTLRERRYAELRKRHSTLLRVAEQLTFAVGKLVEKTDDFTWVRFTKAEYDQWQQDKRDAAAFRSPVPEPARMSREEMVEKAAMALRLELPMLRDDMRYLASAVLTALGFPGEEKEG